MRGNTSLSYSIFHMEGRYSVLSWKFRVFSSFLNLYLVEQETLFYYIPDCIFLIIFVMFCFFVTDFARSGIKSFAHAFVLYVGPFGCLYY